MSNINSSRESNYSNSIEILYEVAHKLPNGAVVSKSVVPTEQLPFNEWASALGVSSSYIPTPPKNRAMEQILLWGIKS
jgi:hypothetical protein